MLVSSRKHRVKVADLGVGEGAEVSACFSIRRFEGWTVFSRGSKVGKELSI